MSKSDLSNGCDDNRLIEVVYKPTVVSSDEKKQHELLKADFSDEPPKSVFLFMSAFAECLIMFVAGTAFSWTSPVIPKLNGLIEQELNPLPNPITPSDESWIASLVCLGGAIGPIIATPAADCIGRKRTLEYLAIPMILSNTSIAFAHHVGIYYVARLILGIGVGGTYSILPMYLGEISENRNRGTIGCMLGVFSASGVLFPFIIGPFLTIKILTLICTAPLLFFLVISMTFIPESPQFLVSVGNIKGAEKALKTLRSQSASGVQQELKGLMQSVKEIQGQKGGIKELFGSYGLRRGITITSGIVLMQQMSGINPVTAFLQPIFDAANSGMSSFLSTNLVAVVQVLATIVTSLMVDRLGRKFLLLFSATVACISTIMLGLYFHLKSKGVDLDNYSWLPVTSLLMYIIGYNLGLGPLPWTVLSELFPSNVKSIASTLTTSTCFTVGFIVTLLFPMISQIVGMAMSFWLFSVCCVGGIIFLYLMVPETKGKSLAEIQVLLSGEK